MPNPKTRLSKMRKRQRRTHYKATAPTLGTCKTTGEVHRLHHAYEVNGDLYYRGQVLVKGKAEESAEEA